jgi:serine/threonine-protein kinase
MAPEQFLLGELRPATDLYALGVVLYEMLAGHPPFVPDPDSFEALRNCHLGVSPPRLTGVPVPLTAVVARALAKDSRDRYPAARDLAMDLAHAACASLGAGWPARARLRLRLDDEIRAVIAGSPRVGPARVALPAAAPRPVPLRIRPAPIRVAGPAGSRLIPLHPRPAGGAADERTSPPEPPAGGAGAVAGEPARSPSGPAGDGRRPAPDPPPGPAGVPETPSGAVDRQEALQINLRGDEGYSRLGRRVAAVAVTALGVAAALIAMAIVMIK